MTDNDFNNRPPVTDPGLTRAIFSRYEAGVRGPIVSKARSGGDHVSPGWRSATLSREIVSRWARGGGAAAGDGGMIFRFFPELPASADDGAAIPVTDQARPRISATRSAAASVDVSRTPSSSPVVRGKISGAGTPRAESGRTPDSPLQHGVFRQSLTAEAGSPAKKPDVTIATSAAGGAVIAPEIISRTQDESESPKAPPSGSPDVPGGRETHTGTRPDIAVRPGSSVNDHNELPSMTLQREETSIASIFREVEEQKEFSGAGRPQAQSAPAASPAVLVKPPALGAGELPPLKRSPKGADPGSVTLTKLPCRNSDKSEPAPGPVRGVSGNKQDNGYKAATADAVLRSPASAQSFNAPVENRSGDTRSFALPALRTGDAGKAERYDSPPAGTNTISRKLSETSVAMQPILYRAENRFDRSGISPEPDGRPASSAEGPAVVKLSAGEPLADIPKNMVFSGNGGFVQREVAPGIRVRQGSAAGPETSTGAPAIDRSAKPSTDRTAMPLPDTGAAPEMLLRKGRTSGPAHGESHRSFSSAGSQEARFSSVLRRSEGSSQSSSGQAGGTQAASSVPVPSAESSSPAAQPASDTDLDRIADRVYDLIERRLRTEKENRGL